MNRFAKTVVDFSFLYYDLMFTVYRFIRLEIKRINAAYLPHQNKEELDIIIIYVAKLRELI